MGGTEQVLAQLAVMPQDAEFEHTVLSLTRQTPGLLQGYREINNLRYPEQISLASNSMSWPLLRDFPKVVRDFDVLHYHFPWPFADLMHCGRRVRKPSIVTYHSDVIRQKLLLRCYAPLMHRFLHAMNTIVATSPPYLESSPVLQTYRDKTVVIPLGIDLDAYPPPSTERMAYWQQRFGERFFLFVGVLRYYKGLPILLEALQGTDYPLVLIGEGPCEQALREQVRHLRLTNVHFLGRISEEDKIALLQLCLAFVFPSALRSEAFGVSLLEAAMLGKPMISTELGTGTSYVNLHNSTGLVVPPNDAVELRTALRYMWEHPEKAQQMGQAAAIRHQTLFTGQQMIQAYEDLYRRVGDQLR